MLGFFCRRNHKHPVNRIFVRDLIVEMQIGVFDVEKGRTQRVRINIDVAPAKWPKNSDDIADTVSYDDLLKIAQAVATAPHTHLVETVAENIAADCLRKCDIIRINVRVEKLEIYPAPTTVGVEITRWKKS